MNPGFLRARVATVAGMTLLLLAGCGEDTSVIEGTVRIDASPDSIEAPWTLAGGGETIDGSGDATLSKRKNGTYTLTWGACVGWVTPARETKELEAGDEIVFTGAYLLEPPGTGSIVLDPQPDYIEAGWRLAGPAPFLHDGRGDTAFTAMESGDYTVTWEQHASMQEPSPNPDTRFLGGGDTLVFEGIYREEFEITIPEMVFVPAGSFVMGDGESFCGTDLRPTTLTRGFSAGRFEVTNAEYLEALEWAYRNGHVIAGPDQVLDGLDGTLAELIDLDDESCEIAFTPGGSFALRDAGHGINPDHPVKEVTWYGAARYCDWLSLYEGLPRAYDHAGNWACNGGDPYGAAGYRLLTDAEWEYAARYNDGRIYPWGNTPPACDRANYGDCHDWTFPVGGHPLGASALGLHDLAGNLYEWCNDWSVCGIGTAPAVDPAGPASGDWRILRGGSWFYNDLAPELRCAARFRTNPSDSYQHYGFRIAKPGGESPPGR